MNIRFPLNDGRSVVLGQTVLGAGSACIDLGPGADTTIPNWAEGDRIGLQRASSLGLLHDLGRHSKGVMLDLNVEVDQNEGRPEVARGIEEFESAAQEEMAPLDTTVKRILGTADERLNKGKDTAGHKGGNRGMISIQRR